MCNTTHSLLVVYTDDGELTDKTVDLDDFMVIRTNRNCLLSNGHFLLERDGGRVVDESFNFFDTTDSEAVVSSGHYSAVTLPKQGGRVDKSNVTQTKYYKTTTPGGETRQ